MTGLLTLGQIATRFGCQLWQVRRLYERGLLPEPERIGRTRIVRREDLPRIEKLLRESGYVAK